MDGGGHGGHGGGGHGGGGHGAGGGAGAGAGAGRRLMSKAEYLDQLAAMDMGFALDNPLYTDREVLVRYVCLAFWRVTFAI